jgi:ParB-like chromosome segregation protein Spo0J
MAKASKPTPGQPLQIEQVALSALIPYARNSRTHSDEQVAQIAASIREFGFTNPVLIDADSGIIAGHGRVMAARKLGMDAVPCLRLGHLSDTQKRAYIIADNKMALNSGWDDELLKLELHALAEADYQLDMTGFDAEELTKIMFGELIEPEEPEEQSVSSSFEVSVSCDGEAEQERVYQMLTKQGLKCRVLTM